MRAIYIGGEPRSKKKSGSMTKIYFFLFLSLIIIGSALKFSAPMIVEEWLNRKGAGEAGYAFTVRDVELLYGKGQMILLDVKVFNPETSTKLIETSNLTIQLNWRDLKNVSVLADKVDLTISKDFSSEVKRIQTARDNDVNATYLNSLIGKIGKLNIIEQREDLSRTVIELNDVNFKVKDFSLVSINKKTEFSISSSIADGGKLNLTGKTNEENGSTPWSIQGTLKQVPDDIFNKLAGDKLPFSFNESRLNAEISARSEHGIVSGEITPDIKRLNIIDKRPGIRTQTIARALTDELTFSLSFILKDELTFQYLDTFIKLKKYRKYSAGEAKVSQNG